MPLRFKVGRRMLFQNRVVAVQHLLPGMQRVADSLKTLGPFSVYPPGNQEPSFKEFVDGARFQEQPHSLHLKYPVKINHRVLIVNPKP